MNWKQFFSLLLACFLFTMAARAQDKVKVVDDIYPTKESVAAELDEYSEQLNDKCPIIYSGDWIIKSITMVGDRYALVDLQAPSTLSMVFSSLTGNTDNVKQVWGKQLRQYGEQWNRFAKLLVRAGRPVVLIVQPDGNPKSALMTLQPSDLR